MSQGDDVEYLDLARWLLDQEGVEALEDVDQTAQAASQVCDKLSRRLSRIFTTAGSEALLRRAMYLSRQRYPLLDGVDVPPSLSGFQRCFTDADERLAHDAAATVFAHMIGLLVTFVGPEIASRALNDIWPGANLGQEGQR